MSNTCSTPAARVCVVCRSERGDTDTNCPDDGGAVIDLRHDPLVGSVFADTYRIKGILGYGATSVVYRVLHMTAKKQFALKVLHPHLMKDHLVLRRFEQESRAASSMNDPHVITVYESGIWNEYYAYFVMDYLRGSTLEQILDSQGFLTVPRATKLFIQIAQGLAHAHHRGVLHRDLKPSNIFVYEGSSGEEKAKLLDFGVAKILFGEHENSAQLSMAGEICGTPTVLSPEQCHGKKLDVRSDIYSLGCLMFESLSGTPPFIGDTVLETMQKHVSQKAPEFEDIVPELRIPWSIASVVFKCLEKEPKYRYQLAEELIADLLALQFEVEPGDVSSLSAN